ncbi:MAG TPA: hypothetical protein VGC84_12540, partial [Ilumatobacteraceae bacterium]
GVTSIATPENVLMVYVDTHGQPSGSRTDGDVVGLNSTGNSYSVTRGESTWNATYVFPPDSGLAPSNACVLCAAAYRGPGSSVVLVNKSPTTDGDLQTKVSVLGDTVVTFDSDWDYVGDLSGALLFARLDQNQIRLGTVNL